MFPQVNATLIGPVKAGGVTPSGDPATLPLVAETPQSLDERLEEIGAQLAWVRDYL